MITFHYAATANVFLFIMTIIVVILAFPLDKHVLHNSANYEKPFKSLHGLISFLSAIVINLEICDNVSMFVRPCKYFEGYFTGLKDLNSIIILLGVLILIFYMIGSINDRHSHLGKIKYKYTDIKQDISSMKNDVKDTTAKINRDRRKKWFLLIRMVVAFSIATILMAFMIYVIIEDL